MKIRTTLLAVGVFLLAVGAFAQVPGRKFRWQSAAMTAANPNILLQREDVRTDLMLQDEQNIKLDELRTHMTGQFQALFADQEQDRDARMKAMRALMKEANDEADKILTPEQRLRLRQIVVQITGNTSVINPDIQKQINLTEEQVQKINDLSTDANAANRKAMERAQSGEITWDSVQDISDKNAKALDVEIGKILTAEQRAKLATVAGRPFKPAPDSPEATPV